MFRRIVEKLIKTFNCKNNIKSRMYCRVYNFVNNVLIIFYINTFIDKNKKFNNIIFVY